MATHPTTSSAAHVPLSAALSAGSAATSAAECCPGSCASSSTPTTPTMASDSTPMIESATRSPIGRSYGPAASLYMVPGKEPHEDLRGGVRERVPGRARRQDAARDTDLRG